MSPLNAPRKYKSTATSWSTANPWSSVTRCCKLRVSNPAPTVRTTAIAICTRTNTRRPFGQAREAEGRCDADSQAGQHSGGQPDAENPAIEGDLRQPRDTHRRHCDQDGDRPASEQQAQRTTGQRKDQAFGDQLSEYPCAGRTERAADRHFSGTVRAACPYQRGHVRTGDEQRQQRCREERLNSCDHVAHVRSL